MTESETPTGADGDVLDRLREIQARSYTVRSDDGTVEVVANGEFKLSTVTLLQTHDLQPTRLSRAVNEACGRALEQARVATTQAIRELEGLPPELAKLLDTGTADKENR
ncbi:YbaB/EbfC family nucleoid-associated protein [Propionibacteriaceae bacterium Y2011]|uniref:YbaB/EbfC family nucleoid-associated protein n=1 Tax=Microlunatus sp. Y2014 TaxID=3418488 RepID=UPI003B466EF0